MPPRKHAQAAGGQVGNPSSDHNPQQLPSTLPPASSPGSSYWARHPYPTASQPQGQHHLPPPYPASSSFTENAFGSPHSITQPFARPRLPTVPNREPRSGMADPLSGPSNVTMISEANSPSSQSQDSRDEDFESQNQVNNNPSRSSSQGGGPMMGKSGGASNTSGNIQSSRRQRVHFSCTECHRRKQKCNRQTPCQHCIARKVPERCKTFQPGNDDSLDLTGRVSKLERTVEDGFDRIMALLSAQGSQSQIGLRSTLPSVSVTASGSTAGQAVRQNAPLSQTKPVADAAGEASDGDEANDKPELNASGGFHGSGAGLAMKIDSLLSGVSGDQKSSNVTLALPLRDGGGTEDLNARMVEYGAAERLSDALMSTLPSEDICRELLAHYFNSISWLNRPIPEKLLRPLFESFLNPPEGYAFPPPLTTANINVFACMMIVISISALSVDSDLFPNNARARRLTARRYEWAGRRALLVSQVLGKEDIIQVIAFQLAWRFLMIDRRVSEAWTCSCAAVHASFAIGLHRDGSKLGLDPMETDLRRGVWLTVRFADYVLALHLGRPPLADPAGAFSDVREPSLAGLQHWWPFDHPQSHPKARDDVPFPSIYQHGFTRTEMTRIWGKIVETYQQIQPHHYSDILALDAEILRVRANLPHYYQVKADPSGNVTCDTSLDEVCPMLSVHRYMIYSEFFMLRINLHRSYLLRSGAKGAGGQRFAPSRKACIESAMEDLAIRDAFVVQMKEKYRCGNIPKAFYVHIGTYSWFNSLLVASIASILDPSMPEIPTIRQHLDRFLKLNEMKWSAPNAAEYKDEMREREAKILSMFIAAIDKMRSDPKKLGRDDTKRKRQDGASADGPLRKRAGEMGHSGTREEATADVLLDLGKGGSSASNTKESDRTTTKANSSHAGNTGHSRSSGTSSSSLPHSTLRGDGSSPDTCGSTSEGFKSQPSSMPTPAAFSTFSGDSPNSHVVDAAQADLDAWFQKEFVGGGGIFDNHLTGLALSDGSQAAGDDSGPSHSNVTPSIHLGSGSSGGIGSGSNSASDGMQEQGNFGGEAFNRSTGIPINFGGTSQGTQRPQALQQGAQSMGASQPPQQPVQWSILPQPVWGAADSQDSYQGSIASMSGAPNASNSANMGSVNSGFPTSAYSQDFPSNHSTAETSFDPNFWAQLIDKIST
ncbi:unnamed protein product [Sympodiomycopsis kandeliae]